MKGCGKDIPYEYHLENEFTKTRTGVLGKCGDLKGFPHGLTARSYCRDCLKEMEK
jgi:hypothetical protein